MSRTTRGNTADFQFENSLPLSPPFLSEGGGGGELIWPFSPLAPMPLCVPRQVSPADWVTVKQDAHFLIQKHVSRSAPTTPTLRFRLGSSASEAANKTNGPYRILMRCNKLCVGEFNDRTELNNQWRFLHPTDSDLAFDASGHDSMQRLWQEQMVSLQEHAPEQSEADFVRPLSTLEIPQLFHFLAARLFITTFLPLPLITFILLTQTFIPPL